MEWRYIESKASDGATVGEEQAREHFGVRDPACPVFPLENGWWAVWFGTPLASPTDYPKLSSKPKDETLAKAYASV